MTEIEALGHLVHLAPPQIIDDEDLHVFLVPPSHEIERRASHVKRTTYDQNIVVMKHMPSEGDADINEVALAVERHVHAINDVLDVNLQLGGFATSVTPPSWDELTAVDWPGGSGTVFAQMAGRVEIEVETITSFVPLPTEVISLALEGMGNLLLENGNALVLEG